MTEKLPDVWTTRDFPVLAELARQIDAGGMPQPRSLASVHDNPDDVRLAVRALERRGLVQVQWFEGRNFAVTSLSGEAYLLTGLHPSGDDAVTALVSALRQAADLVDDPQEKSRLRALADGALGVGRGVLGGVLVNLVTKGVLG